MAKNPTNRDSDQFLLRLPEGLRDLISQVAQSNGRSMNAEIVEKIEIGYGIKNQLSDTTIRKAANVGGLMIAAETINELIKYANINVAELPDHIAYLIEHTKYLRDTAAHGKEFADRVHVRARGNRLKMEKVDYPNTITNTASTRIPRGAIRIKPGALRSDEGSDSD